MQQRQNFVQKQQRRNSRAMLTMGGLLPWWMRKEIVRYACLLFISHSFLHFCFPFPNGSYCFVTSTDSWLMFPFVVLFMVLTELYNIKIQELIYVEDERLKNLKDEYGEQVFNAVSLALFEMNVYNPSGRYLVLELWNFRENSKATVKERISRIVKQKGNKRKSNRRCILQVIHQSNPNSFVKTSEYALWWKEKI